MTKYQLYEQYKAKLNKLNLEPNVYERLIRAYCRRNRI
jgi:hypothetical protein